MFALLKNLKTLDRFDAKGNEADPDEEDDEDEEEDEGDEDEGETGTYLVQDTDISLSHQKHVCPYSFLLIPKQRMRHRKWTYQ